MKTVLITGAAGNLGKAVVERFFRNGFKVIATVSPGKELGYSIDGEIVQLNLADEKAVGESFSSMVKKYPDVQASIFLAGGYHYGGIADTDGSTIDKMLTVNFKTAYFLAQKVFLHMKERGNGGRLIFVGARPALQPNDGKDSFAYALSKSLIFELSELLNAEGAKDGISSTVVVPGIIDTPPNRKAMPDALFDNWVKPAEIANIMAFICSDKATPIRESIIKIYGKS